MSGEQAIETGHRPNDCCDYHRHIADGCCDCEYAAEHCLDLTKRPPGCSCGRAQYVGSPTFVRKRHAEHVDEQRANPECEYCGVELTDEGACWWCNNGPTPRTPSKQPGGAA